MADSGAHSHQHHEHPEHHHFALSASPRTRLAFFAGITVVLILNATGTVRAIFGVDTALLAAIVGGYPLVARAVGALMARRMSSDVTIAVAAIVAVAVGQYLAAAEVAMIVLIGDSLEHWAVHRVDRAIAGLLSVQPDRAAVIREGQELSVPSTDVQLTDRVLVRSGGRVPVDGVVIEGRADIDQSLITGESTAASKGPGDQVFSGTVVEQGAIDIRPERVGEDTTLARIARLVTDARRRRPSIVRTADMLSRYFLPVILVSAVIVFLLTGQALRVAAVLLVACSCALVYAAPAAFAAAMARLGREGILVKGGDVLERLSEVTAVAFDKTGTLTAGRPSIADVIAVAGLTPGELLALAAAAERRSEHSVGRAIVAEAERRGLDIPAADNFSQKPGLGIAARVAGRDVRVGNLTFMRELPEDIAAEAERLVSTSGRPAHTNVVVAIDGRPAGLLILHDAPRLDAAAAIEGLRRAGITEIYLLTGDDQSTASAVAAQVGIDPQRVFACLLPQDKLRHIHDLVTAGKKTLMIGDGVNDAPALASAHVGMAFGRGAADLSAEAAQVVVLEARLTAVPELLTFARKTVRRVRFNIIAFALGVNVAAVVAAGFGYLTPAASAILHQAVSLLVIGGSVSLLVEGRAVGAGLSWTSARESALARLRGLRTTYLPPVAAWLLHHRRQTVRAGLWIAVVVWALSGLVILAPYESAVVLRFGRLVTPDLQPGVHLRAPWPVERVIRVSPRRVRVLEIGFRTPASAPPRPGDLEWDTPHDSGQVQQVEGENMVLTGDENLAELYAVVHYSIADPARFLFGARDPDALARMTVEGTLREIVAGYALDTLLTTGRQGLEQQWAAAVRAELTQRQAGIDVLGIHLTDVHPPREVIAMFRDVASAQEEQITKVNVAEAYAKEQIPKARGNAQASLEAAGGYRASRISRSEGDAQRYLQRVAAPEGTSALTMFRLQMETLETVLAGKPLVITDDRKGAKRSMIFVGPGVIPFPMTVSPPQRRQQDFEEEDR